MRLIYSLSLILFAAFSTNAQAQGYWETGSCLLQNYAGQTPQYTYFRSSSADALCGSCYRHGYGTGVPHPPSSPSVCRHADSVNYINIVYKTCPAGTEWVDDMDGDLVLGTGSCQVPPPEFDCPEGWTKDSITINGTEHNTCSPPLEDDCEVILGYAGNTPICAAENEVNQCLAEGGSYQFSGMAPTCVFNDVDTDTNAPPFEECGSGAVYVINEGCQVIFDDPEDLFDPAEDTDGDGIPNTQDSDIDGDGIPNSSDTDVDGDGIPNSSDNDIDGDGVLNQNDGDMDGDGLDNGSDNDIDGDGTNNDVDTDDDGDGVEDGDDYEPGGPPAEEEEGTEEEQSVTGGGSCEEGNRPNCDGKEPILCAIAIQAWETRCNLEDDKVEGGNACDDDFVCEGDAITCYMAEQQFKSACWASELDPADLESRPEITENTVAALDEGDTDLSQIFDGVFNQAYTGGACPSPDTLNVAGATLEIKYQAFCDFADMLRPLILFFFSLAAFRIVLRAF